MSDTECPYCKAEVDICHDDGYGYEEDQTHQQECGECGKTFTFTTAISFHYETAQAPCLNGGEHDYRDVISHPDLKRVRCRYCDDTKAKP